MMLKMDNVQKMINISATENETFLSDEDDEDQYEDPIGDEEEVKPTDVVDKALQEAVKQLNCDMNQLKSRVQALEATQPPIRSAAASEDKTFLSELSGSSTAFLIAWPFVAFAIMRLCTSGVNK